MIQEWHIERINAAGIQEVKIRSVLTCESKNGVCATCYGRDLARGTPVNMGEAVGVIAAQSIGEPGTQLTMRTFHIGGAAQIADSSFIESNFDGTIAFRNKALARNAEGDLMVMARNVAVVILGPDGSERAVAPRPVRRPAEGRRGRQGEARPAHRRVGPLHPADHDRESTASSASRTSSRGRRCRRRIDEATGIAKRMVMDWRLNQRSASLKPAIVIKGADGKIAKVARGGDARYMLPVESIIAFDPGAR